MERNQLFVTFCCIICSASNTEGIRQDTEELDISGYVDVKVVNLYTENNDLVNDTKRPTPKACWDPNNIPKRPYGQPFLWDLNNTKWCNGFYIEFRQSFAKETFSYDEH